MRTGLVLTVILVVGTGWAWAGDALRANPGDKVAPFGINEPIQDLDNGHWYVSSTDKLNWADAEAAAESMTFNGVAGHLATLTTEAENQWVADHFDPETPEVFWLGGFQDPAALEPDQDWQWVTGEPWVYTHWRTGEPNNQGDEDALQMVYGNQWRDYDQTQALYYLVEFDFPASTTPTVTPTATPTALAPILNPANGHWYMQSSEKKNWADSEATAESMTYQGVAGHLATLTSDAENQWVADHFDPETADVFWLGGFQAPDAPEPDGEWQWVTGEPWVYTHWRTGEPNNQGNEDGLQMVYGNQWRDYDQTQPLYFLIEFDGIVLPTSTPAEALTATPTRTATRVPTDAPTRTPTAVLTATPTRTPATLQVTAHIEPAVPYTNDDLQCLVSLENPGHLTDLSWSYRWFRNSQELLDGMELNGQFYPVTEAVLSRKFTTKNDVFVCSARVTDGLTNWEAMTAPVTIRNSTPTAPVVTIVPENPQPWDGLGVDILQYSVDPDGDPVSYEVRWYRSQDGGLHFVYKAELSGVVPVGSWVPPAFLRDGDVWRVQVIPFELNAASGRSKQLVARTDGEMGWDQVYVGDNHRPTVSVAISSPQAAVISPITTVSWQAQDPDGDVCTVDLYYDTDGVWGGSKLIARGLPAAGSMPWQPPLAGVASPDVNGDGMVDALDLFRWAARWWKPATPDQYWIYALAWDSKHAVGDAFSAGHTEVYRELPGTPNSAWAILRAWHPEP